MIKKDYKETKDVSAYYTNKIAILEEIIKKQIRKIEEELNTYSGNTTV